jgi:hypothetical protein
VVSMIKRSLLCVAMAVALAAVSTSPAFANSPWWHLLSGARPTYLKALHLKGTDAVQDLTVTGIVGEEFESRYILYNKPESAGGVGEVFFVGYDAVTFQKHLEGIYGAGSVEVKGGPEALVIPGEHNESTYEITFKGPLGERPVEPIDIEESKNDGFEPVLAVSQKTAGQLGKPDGTLVASAINVGDTSANACVKVEAGKGKYKDAGCVVEEPGKGEYEAGECVKVEAGKGKYKDAACTEEEPGKGEYEKQPIKVVDKLPPGLEAVSVEAFIGAENQKHVPLSCPRVEGGEVECELPSVPPFDLIEERIAVVVKGHVPAKGEGVSESEINEVSVSGGGAPAASIRRPVKLSEEPVPFGLQSYELTPEEEGGRVDSQAGSHPFQTTFTFETNQTAESPAGSGIVNGNSVGLVRDVNDKFPPGLIGNPQPFQRCSSAQFLARVSECPAGSVVGVVDTTVSEPGHLGIITFPTPLFNLEPEAGEPARFGFIVLDQENPVYINASVRTGGDYGITAEVRDIPQTVSLLSSVVTVWGVPGKPEHNATRGGCLPVTEHGFFPCEAFSLNDPPPFFELPTSCPTTAQGAPQALQSSVELDSWEHPAPAVGRLSAPIAATQLLPALDGCNRLPFDPSIEVRPDVPDASTSTGLTVNVKVPQEESLNADGLGEADVRDTTVTLPAGVQINPSGGDGLEACANDLIGYGGASVEPELEPGVSLPVFTPRKPGSVDARQAGEAAPLQPGVNFCSNASKVATATVTTPLLRHPLEGAVYLAPQEANPFGSLIAMYIVVEDPESGVLLKLPGEVTLDQQTGQLVATFLNTPQAPAEEIELHFFGGERAPLATPAACGTYTTTSSITPWSAPDSGGPATPSSSFQITSGPNGSPCPGAALPFTPSLTAGVLNNQAGSFSPFTMTMNRPDGDQHLQAVQLKMPEGLSGLLAHVELCPEPQANQGACGPNSLIGETTVSVGIGGDPFSVKGGRVYLTGPYNGSGGCAVGSPGCAPFGLSIVNPAKAGPYDLANTKNNHPGCDCVLVRAKIEVDPITAALTVTSNDEGPDKIPTILEGIPLQIQHVNVTVNRPGFTFNPTNCSKLEITGDLFASEGATSTLNVPFQAANCATLKYTPKIAVSTAGHASKVHGASLQFKITYPSGAFGTQSWFSEAKFDLPKQLPARLETLQRACLSKTFEADRGACPVASIIGHATVHTQVLPVPLTGPVYFVSYGGQKFPEAVIVLQGYGITIDLHGETFINNKTGITSATFRNNPDVPFESIEVTIPSGRYSEFGANLPAKDNYNLCGQKLTMPTLFKAQNGQEIRQSTKITITGCKKHKKPKHHTKHKAKHKK